MSPFAGNEMLNLICNRKSFPEFAKTGIQQMEVQKLPGAPNRQLNNSRCQFISSGACFSQLRARSPSTALGAMSVGSMPSLCAC